MKRLITMFIAAGILCSCSGTTGEHSLIRSVELVEPEILDSTRVITHPGIVREAHSINLGFKTPGQIEHIYVREGDYVRQGTLLAELDDADYLLGVKALQIQYDQLEDEVRRTGQLFAQKSVSANDYEKTVAGLNQLGVQLQVNKNKLDYTKLYAPTDGFIRSVNFSPAEMVDAGTSLFTLLDVSHMEVVVDIPVSEYLEREQFMRYYCKANNAAGKIPMRLLSLTPKADGNQLYQLRLAFTEQVKEQLTAGMNVEIGIVVTNTASARGVSVPLCSVFSDNNTNESCVWVFESDSTVTKRQVELGGMDAEGRAVIVGGLKGDERIVRSGVNVLQEGERVVVLEKPGKTNIGGLL